MNKSIITLCFAALIFFPLRAEGQSEPVEEPHPPGSLVVSEGTVHLISDDGVSMSYFGSEAQFLSDFRSFADAVPANGTDQAKPVSGEVPWGDGRLFNDAGTIFQLSGGEKRGFASEEVMRSYGFDFTDAVNGSPDVPAGPPIALPNLGHLPGTMVMDQGTVWLINATGRIGVPTEGILRSWGRQFSDIVPANAEDMSRPVEGVLKIRTGSLINDNGTVWAIRGMNKFGIATAECFRTFGYDFARLIPESTQEYTALGNICTSPPAHSHERTTVQTDRGDFTADIMAFNLAKGEVTVVTDTANDSDCTNNCAVKPLADFVKDNGGFAGINGTYFCPSSYASCAGKTNSFYWKVYNSRLGRMINADNGIKGEQPFIAINGSQVTYHRLYSSWVQTDSPITAGINHEPRLLEGGAVVLDEAALTTGEKSTRTSRLALGVKGQMIYAVAVESATVPDLAAVMKSLGVDYAMHLDGGGSTAMFYNDEYKVGPGRNIPNAIIFK